MGSVRGTAIKLTIFTAFTVVVTFWLAAVIGNYRPFSAPYEVKAQFSDATGLLVGDLVKAAGVNVGRVNAVSVEDGMAVVTLAINEEVKLPVNVEVEIRFRNLIGQRMVAMVPPEVSSSELLQADDVISLEQTEPAFDLTELFNGLRPLIRSTSPRDINIVAKTLTKVLRGRSGQIESLLTNISDVSDTIASEDQSLSQLLDGLNTVSADLASRDEQLDVTLTNINRFFDKILANRKALRLALVNLDDAAVRLDRIVRRNDDDIKIELKSLRQILAVVDQKREDLRGAVRSLPAFLEATERAAGYGQWAQVHLIDVCKDDTGACGTRGRP
jgi:phospholipid/cholesterol/gamma-HCH transport system substrate-binding protein